MVDAADFKWNVVRDFMWDFTWVSLASRIPSKRDHPHADTRSGIDASWLACRGADYAPRLRPSPRMAQESLVSPSFSSCPRSGTVTARSSFTVHAGVRFILGRRRCKHSIDAPPSLKTWILEAIQGFPAVQSVERWTGGGRDERFVCEHSESLRQWACGTSQDLKSLSFLNRG